MRLLLVHNFYQNPGGEDQVFSAETDLLRGRGHSVSHYTVHNSEVAGLNPAALAKRTLWNSAAAAEVRAICRSEQADVVHFHNTFPLVSPAAYYAARAEGAAVVQTLHNFRLLCPGTTFFRDGQICEECLGKRVPLPGVRHACYRGSRMASLGVATMAASHRLLGTWDRAVDTYVAPTEFLKSKFLAGGLPEERITVKPHFLPVDPKAGTHRGGYALFVGRLVEEKGIRTMLQAWTALGGRLPLKVAGDGPLSSLFQRPPAGVEWLGQQDRAQVATLMQNASFLIFPSEWYEAFGLTILEAFGTGLPVIASQVGAAGELVEDGLTGLHYRSGDGEDLVRAVVWALDHQGEMSAMGERARLEYLARYTADANYHLLAAIYEEAVQRRAGRGELQSRVHPAPGEPVLRSRNLPDS